MAVRARTSTVEFRVGRRFVRRAAWWAAGALLCLWPTDRGASGPEDAAQWMADQVRSGVDSVRMETQRRVRDATAPIREASAALDKVSAQLGVQRTARPRRLGQQTPFDGRSKSTAPQPALVGAVHGWTGAVKGVADNLTELGSAPGRWLDGVADAAIPSSSGPSGSDAAPAGDVEIVRGRTLIIDPSDLGDTTP